MKKNKQNQGGYIALISVLISSAVLILVGIGSTMQGIDVGSRASGEESSLRALLLADACAEEALMKLRANLDYAGNETIIVGEDGSCVILPILGSGNIDRIVNTRASVNNYIRNTRVIVTRVNPLLTISSWVTVQ